MQLVVGCRTISSVKGELIPHLVRRQWTQADGTSKTDSVRRQGQQTITNYCWWLVVCLALQTHATSCLDDTEQLALSLSSFAGYQGTSAGLLSPFLLCHALEVSDQLCLRVNSVPSFMEANRLVQVLL